MLAPQGEAGCRGYGAAQKIAVAKMVQRMLNLPQLPEADAADALGSRVGLRPGIQSV
jgi:Holliday junction resolvasome RuvABC endonuclease subunit